MGKVDKYGRYVCKVGYLDIRQKIVFSKRVKDRVSGNFNVVPGYVTIFIYHGKKMVESGFKSHEEAKKRAEELQCK